MPSHSVRVEQLAGIPLAVVRRSARASDLSRVVPQCCGLVWKELQAQNVRGGRQVAIHWDSEIRLEVGAEVSGPFAEQGEIVRSATPAGEAAFATHLGPYSGLGAAHRAIREWCSANGRELAGPNWEIYGHWQPEWNNRPELIRTDVYYQLSH